jgi:hypothetical protein
MGNGRPRPLNDGRRGQHHTRSSPAGDGHGERRKLRLQLLELLFEAHGLGDLHQGTLKLLGIVQGNQKEADLPPLAQARPACFWRPHPQDVRARFLPRDGRPVGEVAGLE